MSFWEWLRQVVGLPLQLALVVLVAYFALSVAGVSLKDLAEFFS